MLQAKKQKKKTTTKNSNNFWWNQYWNRFNYLFVCLFDKKIWILQFSVLTGSSGIFSSILMCNSASRRFVHEERLSKTTKAQNEAPNF